MNGKWTIRMATEADVPAICAIYNQGIEDRIATLEETPKTLEEMRDGFRQRTDRYTVLVIEVGDRIRGWASLSHRCAYAGVADLPYTSTSRENGVERDWAMHSCEPWRKTPGPTDFTSSFYVMAMEKLPVKE
ncbi:MAG TPA: hypothetical protein VIK75_06980 [Calditerricola sp.]